MQRTLGHIASLWLLLLTFETTARSICDEMDSNCLPAYFAFMNDKNNFPPLTSTASVGHPNLSYFWLTSVVVVYVALFHLTSTVFAR
ncbi:hypothetical protein BCR33DRAFT_517333 [Rhizoclosmatium globosum]|uniref:Uncharacterized protein n=1 Tax=Rhizoclosmatium globosum TaxID=329046 RepID=A0A1Y2BGD6_9FUNG|nr:hypothetical protein BCR33DRAFT_517333 [Rhizoclosmatium globosum]|eukprot:ORY33881.1 hypothetical protein BCR33DRAFT_517333 [Rhizoclosmatium globosum]